MRRSIVSPVIALACVVSASSFTARTAKATDNFPGVIAAHLELSAPPDCTVCHVSSAGGRGTVTKPFGASLRSRGLQAYDEASLRTALDALAAEGKDSDGDGTADIAELTAGENPNAGAGSDEAIVPEYGCAVGRAPVSSGGIPADAASAGVLTALALLASRSRRRRA